MKLYSFSIIVNEKPTEKEDRTVLFISYKKYEIVFDKMSASLDEAVAKAIMELNELSIKPMVI